MGKKYILPINTENLDKILLTKEEEFPEKLKEFNRKYVKTKCDRYGNEENVFNPLAVANFFFTSINPLPNIEPTYESEQLGKVWDLYKKFINEINLEIGTFNPTLTHFAKFAGITMEKLQEYKTSVDESMRTLANKIFNEIYDSNILLAQNKKLVVSPTEYRMKYENEALEKHAPTVNINLKAKELDLAQINAKISEINRITNNKKNYEGN